MAEGREGHKACCRSPTFSLCPGRQIWPRVEESRRETGLEFEVGYPKVSSHERTAKLWPEENR